jgi:hypothetical protein
MYIGELGHNNRPILQIVEILKSMSKSMAPDWGGRIMGLDYRKWKVAFNA